MSHSNTNVPNPPYSYNDYRITYNEKCFFYNGGYDLTCLVTRDRTRGVGTAIAGKYIDRSYPSKDMVDLIFKVCIDYVNDKEFSDEEHCEIKKYTFQKKDSLSIRTEKINVSRRILNITSDDFSVKTINKFLSSSNPYVKDNKTTISSSMEKLKTYVSSSLHFSSPKKIKVKSAIIKREEDKK